MFFHLPIFQKRLLHLFEFPIFQFALAIIENNLTMKRLALPLLLLTFAVTALAQRKAQTTQPPKTIDQKYFSEMKYRSVGPSRGGRATAVAGIPQSPYTFYMGSQGGGVWRTDDAGWNWENITDGQFEVL